MTIANKEIYASQKRSSRITDARLAVKQADRYIQRYPATIATPTVRDMRLALQGMLDEVDGK